ncbi:MAG: hypothetical protein KC619_28270 [Myxococcales bacterium]|nr:hypothetical protein [Myxococcales bacterium]
MLLTEEKTATVLAQLDEGELDVAVVALPPPVGMGRAIADRLRRAAS